MIPAPFVILSAELSTETDESNAARTMQLREALSGFEFERADGCYKGTREASYIVRCPDERTYGALLLLGRAYSQESVLHVDHGGAAALVFLQDGARLPIGTFQQVSATEARALDAFTETASGEFFAAA